MDETTFGDEDTIVCNLCGQDDPQVVFAKGLAQPAQIVRCRNCGLMYSNPRAQAVDHELYEQHEPEGILKGVTTDPTHPWHWRYQKESGQVRDFRATRKLLRKLYPQPGHMIEVGSGFGYLLRSFKDEGWDVLGVDPWRELPPLTREIHGIETRPTTLEDAGLPDNSTDVVILLHVIEHVPDPHATLSEINRVLKPGGHLVVETPRYDTAMFRLLGHRERSIRCDGHIYFFTFDTLRRCCEKAGFSEVERQAVGRTLSMERFLWNVGTVAGSEALRQGVGRFSRATGLDRLKFTLNLRDMQRMTVRKEAPAA